jgi:hypothetical protein
MLLVSQPMGNPDMVKFCAVAKPQTVDNAVLGLRSAEGMFRGVIIADKQNVAICSQNDTGGNYVVFKRDS